MIGNRVESSQTDIGDRGCFIPLSVLKEEIIRNINWRVFRSFFSHFLEVAFSPYGSYPLTHRSFFLIQIRFQLHSLSCRYPVFLAQFSECTFLHCMVLASLLKISWHICRSLFQGILFCFIGSCI